VSGQRLGIVHRLDAAQSHNRPLAMKPHAADRQRLDASLPLDEQLGARLKPLLREVGLEIQNHLASKPVRPGDAAHERHVIPGHEIAD